MEKRMRMKTIAGGAFDGGAPAGSPTFDANGVADYPAAASSLGLFDPGTAGSPLSSLYLERFTLHSSAAMSAWSLDLVRDDSSTVNIFKGKSGDTDFVQPTNDKIEILPGEKIKLTASTTTLGVIEADAVFRDKVAVE